MPPVYCSSRRTVEATLPSARPIPSTDSSALYLRQSSAHWAVVNIRSRPRPMAITSLCQTIIEVFR